MSTGVGLLPVIGFRSWWDAILNLTEKKVIVILAAGNGGLDVGNTAICPDFGDCGGLLVGACYPTDGRKYGFSNFGHYASLINSWGGEVTTTGSGDLQTLPGNNRNYTAKYHGTSSATPLCAGALALIQSYAKQQGTLLSPAAMKAILALSDNNEGLPDKVGKRPNVKLAMTQVDEMLVAPVAGEDPFPLPSTFMHANVRFEYDRDSVVTVPFDFRNAGLLNAGLVTFYAEEGPSKLEWYSYGVSQLKVPITDEYKNVRILYLQANKVIPGNIFTMNSAADIKNQPSWGFDLRLTCRWLDNMYLPQGKYHGLLPLYVKQYSGTFTLPVKIRIQVD
ncbi:S8 family serine peptidase [Pseudomonas asiatica]|uniref:S8 family serine peptidase n=1 Tax=Pseudomonas asiatica TaxID=2219225 RepID=UPI003839EAB9